MNNQNKKQSNSNNQRFYYGYIIASIAFVSSFSNAGMIFSFGVFFKPLLNEFGWTRAMTSGAFTISRIFQAISSVAMGGLTDKIGPRVVISLCGLLIGLGYLLMSQVNNIWQLYIFYGLLTGIGSGGITVSLMSTIVRWFTINRNLITSVVIAGGALGTLVLPLVASRLIDAYDWRMSYLIMGSSILIIVVILAQFIKRAPIQTRQVSYEEDRQNSRFTGEGLHLKKALHDRQFWLAFALQFINGFLVATIMVHIVPHATDIGISALSAANILAIMGGIAILGTIFIGIAGDKFGIKRTFIISFLVVTVSYFWISNIDELWMFYLFAVVVGLISNMGLLTSPLVAESFGLKAHGLIFGVMNLSYSLGSATGPLLAGYIFDITGSYMMAFPMYGTLGIIAVIVASLLRSTRIHRPS